MAQPYVVLPANGSDPADEWVRLGLEAQMANKFPDAERHYRHALRLNPRHALACQNLAVLFAQMGNINEGLLTIERAGMFDANHSVIHVNRAFMNLEADRIDEALEASRQAVTCSDVNSTDPTQIAGYSASRLALAMVCSTAGIPDQAIPLYREILAREPKHPIANPNSCFVQTLTFAGPEELLAQRKVWYAANRYDGPRPNHTNVKDLDRPIRIGYVGGDFKRHSASMIFGNVVLNHDREHYQPYLYSSLPVDPVSDPASKQFIDMAGPNWRDIAAQSDEQVEALVRQDKIDILVDLAAHTGGGRLGVFCRKPAPIQVTAWGYAHGTGIPEMDYFFADPIAVREEERQHYAEKIIDLPCVVTYNPPIEYSLKGKSALPYFQNDYITFGSYARYEKLSDECLRAFGEILRRVPGSKLQFKDHAFRRPYSIRRVMRLLNESAAEPIASDRVLFSISTSHPDHMLTYQQADLILDPFPHGGGVVAMEQLYMGVPIVTLYGPQPAGRSASSILIQMGHPDWIARSPGEYVERAVAMAEDTVTLNRVRKVLRDELLASPVVAGYREATEAAYRSIWKEWCSK